MAITETQIVCVDKSQPNGSHQHITHLGTPLEYLVKSEVVRRIKSGLQKFYTLVNGKKAYLEVRDDEPGKTPYVQTHADGYWNNNLLALNACPLR